MDNSKVYAIHVDSLEHPTSYAVLNNQTIVDPTNPPNAILYHCPDDYDDYISWSWIIAGETVYAHSSGDDDTLAIALLDKFKTKQVFYWRKLSPPDAAEAIAVVERHFSKTDVFDTL